MRAFIADLLHFARTVPSVPVSRVMDLGPIAKTRSMRRLRPSWSVIFMKAFARVASRRSALRRCWLTVPRTRLYEHPVSIGSMALERSHEGEPAIFVGLFRAPESQSLMELQEALDWYKNTPLEEIGLYRRAIRTSKLPQLIRRFLWWSSLRINGAIRARRLGTFGVSSYGALGAESLHPISPLTVTLTYGPIGEDGQVTVKLIYDHRVLDGAEVARRLAEIEAELNGPIRDELRGVVDGVESTSPETRREGGADEAA